MDAGDRIVVLIRDPVDQVAHAEVELISGPRCGRFRDGKVVRVAFCRSPEKKPSKPPGCGSSRRGVLRGRWTDHGPVRQKIPLRYLVDRPASQPRRLHIFTARFPRDSSLSSARLASSRSCHPVRALRQRFLARSVSPRGNAGSGQAGATSNSSLFCLFYDPDVEWHGTVGGHRRRKRASPAIKRWIQGFDDFTSRVWGTAARPAGPEEIIDTGDQLIVFVSRQVARGRRKRRGRETDTATVNTLRGGMIVRVRSFMDRGKPSKPPGSRSRRCRRRTWRSCGGLRGLQPTSSSTRPFSTFDPRGRARSAHRLDSRVWRGHCPEGLQPPLQTSTGEL